MLKIPGKKKLEKSAMKSKFFICMLTCLLVSQSCSDRRVSNVEKYLIPDGYQGAIAIAFDLSAGSPSQYENTDQIFVIPSDGILKTQEVQKFGTGLSVKYFYTSKDGKRELIKVGTNPQDAQQRKEIRIWQVTTGRIGFSDDSCGFHVYKFYVGVLNGQTKSNHEVLSDRLQDIIKECQEERDKASQDISKNHEVKDIKEMRIIAQA